MSSKKEKDQERVQKLAELKFKVQFHEDVIAFHEHFKKHWQEELSKVMAQQLPVFNGKEKEDAK